MFDNCVCILIYFRNSIIENIYFIELLFEIICHLYQHQAVGFIRFTRHINYFVWMCGTAMIIPQFDT